MFKLSNKKGIKGEILSQVLEKAGIEVIINSNLSERLCKPCAAKLRRTCEGMINVVNRVPSVGQKELCRLPYLSIRLSVPFFIFQFVTENGKCQTPH